MSAAEVAGFVGGLFITAMVVGFLGVVFGMALGAAHNQIIEDSRRPGSKDYEWHPFKRMWKIAIFPLRPFRSRTRRLEERLQRACVLEAHLTKHTLELASDDPWRPYFDTLKVEATRKREALSTDLKQAVAQGYAKKLKRIGE